MRIGGDSCISSPKTIGVLVKWRVFQDRNSQSYILSRVLLMMWVVPISWVGVNQHLALDICTSYSKVKHFPSRLVVPETLINTRRRNIQTGNPNKLRYIGRRSASDVIKAEADFFF